jgi:predicted nuclease of predicted toxin-antitoxin system
MRIKLDENLSRYLKPDLSALGHDAETVAEEGLLSQPDTVVGAAARRVERTLFTLDVGFADLRKYPPGAHPGIVVFRPVTMGPRTVNAFVLSFVRNADLEKLRGCLVIVAPDRVRVRCPPATAPGRPDNAV